MLTWYGTLGAVHAEIIPTDIWNIIKILAKL